MKRRRRSHHPRRRLCSRRLCRRVGSPTGLLIHLPRLARELEKGNFARDEILHLQVIDSAHSAAADSAHCTSATK